MNWNPSLYEPNIAEISFIPLIGQIYALWLDLLVSAMMSAISRCRYSYRLLASTPDWVKSTWLKPALARPWPENEAQTSVTERTRVGFLYLVLCATKTKERKGIRSLDEEETGIFLLHSALVRLGRNKDLDDCHGCDGFRRWRMVATE